GLVPMSPNTTPSAPSSKAAPTGWAATAGVETAAGEVLFVVPLSMDGRLPSGRGHVGRALPNAGEVSWVPRGHILDAGPGRQRGPRDPTATAQPHGRQRGSQVLTYRAMMTFPAGLRDSLSRPSRRGSTR